MAAQEEDQREALEVDFEVVVGERLEVGEGMETEGVEEEVGAEAEEEAVAASARVEVEEGEGIQISQDLGEHFEGVVRSQTIVGRHGVHGRFSGHIFSTT